MNDWALEAKETLDLIATESALLTLRGVGVNEQVKHLHKLYPKSKVSRTKLLTLKEHPSYKEAFLKAADEMVVSGQIQIKTGCAELVPLILACLKTKLSEGDVKAAVAAINVLTGVDKDDGNKQAQQLNIIMPGATPPIKP